MTGADRRVSILRSLRESDAPLTGSDLAKMTGVSRQVVVQDIALLRGQGHRIVATRAGYSIAEEASDEDGREVRLVKVRHGPDEVEEELLIVVDHGGVVLDVTVNHRAYGKLSAPLLIESRRDAARFIDDIRSGKSSLLSTVTSGYHFHRIAASGPDAAAILDEIEADLGEKGFLAEVLPYEIGVI